MTILIDPHIEYYWSATNLAVLDIFLHLNRAVDQYMNGFPAIRALDIELLKPVSRHDRGRIRIILPLSVEK